MYEVVVDHEVEQGAFPIRAGYEVWEPRWYLHLLLRLLWGIVTTTAAIKQNEVVAFLTNSVRISGKGDKSPLVEVQEGMGVVFLWSQL